MRGVGLTAASLRRGRRRRRGRVTDGVTVVFGGGCGGMVGPRAVCHPGTAPPLRHSSQRPRDLRKTRRRSINIANIIITVAAVTAVIIVINCYYRTGLYDNNDDAKSSRNGRENRFRRAMTRHDEWSIERFENAPRARSIRCFSRQKNKICIPLTTCQNVMTTVIERNCYVFMTLSVVTENFFFHANLYFSKPQ